MIRLSTVIIGGILIASVVAGAHSATAIEPHVFKIEEDWEMAVSEPDAANCSPQVTFFTSPSFQMENCYFQLQMNYAADEGFESGGFHVAAVVDEAFLDEARSATQLTLASSNDLIRWTSVMATINNKLLFAVRDGTGNEWGSFGGPDYLVTIVPSPVVDLNDYAAQQSLDNVDIGFGANRVTSITLKRVRLFYTDGTSRTITVNGQP